MNVNLKIVSVIALLSVSTATYAQTTVKETAIEYCKGGGIPLLMDIVYPTATTAQSLLPAVILIHGGSWRGGLRGGMMEKAEELANRGYFAATIDYRLTQYIADGRDPMKAGVKYNEMIQDVKCAVRYLKTKADQYGIDPNRVATFGTSAGGHLATMIGVNRDARQDQNGQYLTVDSSVAAVVSWFGPQDLAYNYEKVPSTQFYLEELLGGTPYTRPDNYYNASPLHHVSTDDPSIITIHGTDDETVPVEVAKAFDRACKNQGLEHVLVIIPGGTHGLYEHTAEAMDKTINFLDSKLK